MTWRRVGVLPGARLTGRGRAAGLLPALATLVFWGLATLPQGTGSTPTDGYGDVDLYREIAAGVAAGGNYYTVAIQTQLAHDFPTSPFTAVRLPTMTFVQNAFGEGGASLLLIALTAVALLAMTVWMRSAGVLRAELLASVLILGANLAHSAVDGLSWFHDAWAGVLIVLAIALRTSKAWWLAAAVGFSAVCFRELALPFLLVMVVIAWPRRREAVAWGGAIVAFAGVYVLHALAVAAAQPPVPVQSNGWLDLGGWKFILGCARRSSRASLWSAAPTTRTGSCCTPHPCSPASPSLAADS